MKRTIAALLIALILFSVFPGHAEETAARILFINVGKADSALIVAGGKAYLVDTGEKESAPAVLAALNAMGVSELDGVFLTHTHSDHIGGMKVFAPYVRVKTLYAAEISLDNDKGDNKIDKLADSLSLPLVKLKAGDTLSVSADIRFDVLGPLVLNTDDDNDNSLVMMLTVGGARVLLTGDMQYAEEQTLLSAGADLNADILKVGNHGNPDATMPVFASAVNPAYAVLSTDTMVDHDSANPFVLAQFPDAEIFLTENAQTGVLFQIRSGGGIDVQSLGRPQNGEKAALASASIRAQSVVIENRGGEDIDLSRWMLFSTRGAQLFVFPKGALLPAGASVTVASKSEGDYLWPEDNVWHKSKEDIAILYDALGSEIDRLTARD